MSTIKVIRGNKVVRVTENELDKYLSKGYVIKDGGKLDSESIQPTPKKYEPVKADTLYKEAKKPEIKSDTKQVKKTQRKSYKK